MSEQHNEGLTLEQLDVDGAIQEAASQVDGETRSAFLRKAGVFGGSIVAGGAAMGALPALATAQSNKQDLAILNFALTLEYLEAAFYAQGIRSAGLRGRANNLVSTVNRHEHAHVRFLRKALGKKAVARPRFDFRGTTEGKKKFLDTAFVLENEGVAAYAGQGPRIKNEAYVKAALSILTIEARHAAAFAMLRGRVGGPKGITPKGAFDKPKSMSRVLKDVGDLKFIR